MRFKIVLLILCSLLGRHATAESIVTDPAKVDMDRRTEELQQLRFGMFVCWSFSTFSGKEWTPRHRKRRFLQGDGMRYGPVVPHGQGGRHGLYPVPDQTSRRLLPVGH